MTAFADHGAGENGEPLAIVLRTGSAGPGTAADHIEASLPGRPGCGSSSARSGRGRDLTDADDPGIARSHQLIVFLLVMHHVPVERCAEVIAALTGTRPSDGFARSMIVRAAKAMRGVNMLIRALVITASVLSADETPIRVGPGPKTGKNTRWSPAPGCSPASTWATGPWRAWTRSCSWTCPAP